MTDAYTPRHAVTRPRQPAAPGPLAAIFRRILGRLRREQAAPGPVAGQGGSPDGATPGAAGHDVPTDAEIAALTPRRVLPREDGDIVIDQAERIHVRPVPLARRERRDGKQPWETAQLPVYGEAAQLTVAPELARQEAS